jgi:hypothetical protein
LKWQTVLAKLQVLTVEEFYINAQNAGLLGAKTFEMDRNVLITLQKTLAELAEIAEVN